MTHARKPRVETLEIGDDNAGQRIDNFLIKHMKGVPKTRLYRALRGGEVRVNSARKKATYQLQVGDKIRLPPLRRSAEKEAPHIPESLLNSMPILLEDDDLLIVDKPAGLAVHGGTGMDFGLIEALRKLRNDLPYLELAHRLDRETSGCLMLAKNRAALLMLHAQLGNAGSIKKEYLALVMGEWQGGKREIKIPLSSHAKQAEAHSIFTPKWSTEICSLVTIQLKTGRMHQARLHAAAIKTPIAGDRQHGNQDFNKQMKKHGLTRLFLHAKTLKLTHPKTNKKIKINAPLPEELTKISNQLKPA